MYREIGCQLVERVDVTDDLDMRLDEEALLAAAPPNIAATAFVTSLLPDGQRLPQYFHGTALLVAHTDLAARQRCFRATCRGRGPPAPPSGPRPDPGVSEVADTLAAEREETW